MQRNYTKSYKIFKIIGNNIKNIRTKKEITLKQLSKKTGISEKYLKKIEEGEATGMSSTHLFKLAEALNVKVYSLVM